MSTILDALAEHARERVKRAPLPLAEVRRAAEQNKGDFAFEKALGAAGTAFICECKKASPSKGIIAHEFPYLDIARDYEKAGADAISVLTEPKWFLGQNEYLREISAAVAVPTLRKDFIVDEYMIYEARALGASAALLICAILEPDRLKAYLALCNELGLSALVEAHDESEIETALWAGARVIGVNNRDLKDFSVDVNHAAALRKNVPDGVLFVAESGIRTPADVAAVKFADAVLIGESLMRAKDKAALLAAMREAAR